MVTISDISLLQSHLLTLHFGVGSLVLQYRNQREKKKKKQVCEVQLIEYRTDLINLLDSNTLRYPDTVTKCIANCSKKAIIYLLTFLLKVLPPFNLVNFCGFFFFFFPLIKVDIFLHPRHFSFSGSFFFSFTYKCIQKFSLKNKETKQTNKKIQPLVYSFQLDSFLKSFYWLPLIQVL